MTDDRLPPPPEDDERMRTESADRMRRAFRETALHELLDLKVVQVRPEPVIVEMPVNRPAFNTSGNLHGGAIATLIDVAAGTAAAVGAKNFEPGKNTLVTADMHIRYLGRAKGDVVRAEARVIRAGRQLTVVEARILDSDDHLIALADFSSMVVPLRQPIKGFGDARNPDL